MRLTKPRFTGRSGGVLSVFLALAVLAGCSGRPSAAAAEPEKQEVVRIPVDTRTVERADISASYKGTATLEAAHQATVVAKTSGVLREIKVREGDRVEAGDVLAQLEKSREKLAVQQARAQLKRLESDFKRTRELYKRDLVSADQFEKARYQYRAQKAAFKMAKLALDHTSVEAPINGIVTRRLVKEGNLIQQYQALFQIHDFTPVHAVVHIPGQQMGLVKPGLPVVLTTAAYPGKRFHGEVLRVSPVVDADTGTFEVTTEFANEQHKLKPGMFVNVRIVYETHENVPVIPRVALLNEDGRTSVFIVEDGVAHRKPVTLGISSGGRVEILEGLKPGQAVVTVGQATLEEGTHVEVVGRDEAGEGDDSGGREADGADTADTGPSGDGAGPGGEEAAGTGTGES